MEISGFKWKNCFKYIPRTKIKSPNITKVRSLMVKNNPSSQRTVSKSLKCSLSTVNKIINNNLNFKKSKDTMLTIESRT